MFVFSSLGYALTLYAYICTLYNSYIHVFTCTCTYVYIHVYCYGREARRRRSRRLQQKEPEPGGPAKAPPSPLLSSRLRRSRRNRKEESLTDSQISDSQVLQVTCVLYYKYSDQETRKAIQHNTMQLTQDSHENELPQVVLKPVTFCILGKCSTN